MSKNCLTSTNHLCVQPNALVETKSRGTEYFAADTQVFARLLFPQ